MNIVLNEKLKKIVSAMEVSKFSPLSKFAGEVLNFSPAKRFSFKTGGKVYVGMETVVKTQKAIMVDTVTKSGRPTRKEQIVTETNSIRPNVKVREDEDKTQIHYYLMKNSQEVYTAVLDVKEKGNCTLKIRSHGKKTEYNFKCNGKKITQCEEKEKSLN